MFYKAIVGDSDDFNTFTEASPELEDLFFIIFFILTIFFIVIMLNMLIAIISETFNRVTALEKKAFLYERLNLIVEYEKVLKEGNENQDKSKVDCLYVAQIHDPIQEELERRRYEENIPRTQIKKILDSQEKSNYALRNLDEKRLKEYSNWKTLSNH